MNEIDAIVWYAMKERVLDLLEKMGEPLRFEAILFLTGFDARRRRKEKIQYATEKLQKLLASMEEEGKIFRDSDGNWSAF